MFRLDVRRVRPSPAQRTPRILPFVWPAYRNQASGGGGYPYEGSWRIGSGVKGQSWLGEFSWEWETPDQLRDTLAASEGIGDVLHEDREVFHLKVEESDISAVEGKVAEAVERTGIGYGGHSPQ